MARDPLERRGYSPTVPNDADDPPRYGQLIETTKDALVLELRTFLEQQNFTTERREELPTVEKYATGFGAGLDPYETFVKIVEDFPDVLERLPTVAVTAAAGQNRRMTAGRPFIAHTQAPPRVVTANAGPYALAEATYQVSVISVTTLPGVGGASYTVTVSGVSWTTAVLPDGSTATEVAEAIRAMLKPELDPIIEVTATKGVAAQVTLRGRTLGESFVVAVGAGLSVATTPAGAASAPDMLVYQTNPGGRNEKTSTTVFAAQRFPATAPASAATAEDVVRIINEQGLYAQARVVGVGAGSGVQLENGGPFGGKTPNEVEVMASSTRNAVSVLGLGNFGNAAPGDTIGGEAPLMELNVAGAGYTAAMEGRYVTIDGAPTAANNGRFLVDSVGGGGQLTFVNAEGVPEAIGADVEWFIGYRDDSTNPARPVQNRYHMAAQLTINIDILGESPNIRRELGDLIFSEFLFFLEEKHFTLFGRGVFDESYPDEHYEISIHQEVGTAEADFPRSSGDQKDRIYNNRITLPITIWYYIDRQVLVPSGPSQGESWTLEAENISEDQELPFPS